MLVSNMEVKVVIVVLYFLELCGTSYEFEKVQFTLNKIFSCPTI